MASLSPNQIAALIMETQAFDVDLNVVKDKSAFGGLFDFDIEPLDDRINNNLRGIQGNEAAIKFLDIAIAVCLAESGGNPSAANPNSNARGLWQIMTTVHGDKISKAVAKWEPVRNKGKLTILDPYVNTQVAGAVYKASGSWRPWEVYNTGAYRGYLGHGKDAHAYLSSAEFQAKLKKRGQEIDDLQSSEIPGQDALNNGIPQAISSAVASTTTFLKDAGIAVGVFILGLVVFILGVWFVVSQSSAGKAALNASPVGRVSKVVKR